MAQQEREEVCISAKESFELVSARVPLAASKHALDGVA